VARRPNQADYDVLGVAPGAPLAEARAAYHRRARVLHPDTRPDATPAELARLVAAMATLNAAWEAIEAAGEPAAAAPPPAEPPRAETPPHAGQEPPPRPRRPSPMWDAPAGFAINIWRRGPEPGYLRLVGEPSCLAGLAPHAEQVRVLVLTDRPVTDDDLRRLPVLPRLRRLDLTGTPITDAALPVAVERAPALHELDLSATRVTDAGLAGLAAAAELQELALVDTSISDAGLAAIARLRSLVIVNLRRSAVRGEALDVLATLPNLRLLALPRVPRAVRRRFEELRPDVELT
jgi:hypothetical protein